MVAGTPRCVDVKKSKMGTRVFFARVGFVAFYFTSTHRVHFFHIYMHAHKQQKYNTVTENNISLMDCQPLQGGDFI